MSEKVAEAVNTARTSFTPLPEAKQVGDHYVALPNKSEDGWVHAHARQTIQAEPQALYAMWSDVEKFPLWQEQVVSVTRTGAKTSHWVMGDPEDEKGTRVEFDSEITEDVPASKIAWATTAGEVEQHGEVHFAARRDGRGTVVTLIQHFKIGKLANMAAGVAKRSPKQTVIEDLRHFKQMAEAGEIPSVKGQPHGPRGISGGVKEWMYGETNATPVGSSEQV